MPHFLVAQLRFTRSEFVRGLEGVTPEEAARHFEPMNSISWIVGHLAWQGQTYWLERSQGKILVPELQAVAYGQPQSTPPLEEMWVAWHSVTQAADAYLDTLTSEILLTTWTTPNAPTNENLGTRLLRMIYHYWYHLGESQAIRQLLGHTDLPGFVGYISAPYEGKLE